MKNRLLKLAGAFAAALALSFVACGGNNDPEEAGGGVVLVTGVSLDKAGLILKEGGASASLVATVAPAAADNKTVSWSSGNSAVATVVGSGATATVSPVAAGRTNITVTTADGGRVAICTVTVDAAVTGVTVSPAVLDMMIGGAPASLRASVQPANSVSQNVMWLSSAPGIAAVTGIGASATVVPVAAGTATITAVSEADGSKAGTAVVTVRPKLAATYVAANLGLIRNGEFIVEGTFFHDVYIDEQYNVHATAFRHDDHTKGLYYLNGEMTVLPSDSWANLEVLGMGLHVTNDGHVYIAGYEVSQSRNFQAMLWKDGVSQNLGSATTYQAQAEAVTVHNGHVYVLGIYINSGGQLESCLWIDGQFAPFGASYRATARSLAVTEDGTLYVGGELGLIAIDVASGTYRDILDASGEYYQDIGGLCAVGNNVYAAGFDDYYYAPAYYYDKYRNKHELPLALSDSSFGEAYGIRVADNGDVYVAGYEYGYWYDWIVWWVNGVVHRADHDTGAYPYDNFAYMAHARGVDTGYVPSTGVTVTGANTTVVIGGTTTLSASVQPAGATNKSMDWSSSNTAVATVRGNGSTATVTGVSDGVAMIKATSYDGAIGACQVTVRKVSVAGVTLTSVPSPMNLNLGYSGNVAATILPANATVRTIHWTSNNPAVASVAPPTGASAVVTANAVGTARITATSPDGPSASLTVNVNTLAATGIRLPAEFAVGLGKTKGLAATIIPAQATNQNATWTSSNTAIATVSGTGLIGSVTGVALGEAIIRVTTLDGGHSASCTVSVLEKADPDIYVAGHFGVYKNGVYDARFPDSDPLSPGSSGMEDVSVDASGAIHTAGFYLDWDHPQHGYTYMFEAAHYIDGRREILEMNHGDDDIESGATSIFVEGMDYYIAGYEYHYEPGTSILDVAPRLWKNGKIQTLQSHEDEGYGEYSFANKVLVKNGSVYVGGYTRYAEDYWERPVLWKDGERHIDMHEEDFRVIDFGVTDNNYIYALMRCAYPSLWGVSTYSVWRISPDYGTWQHQFNMYPAEYGAQKWSELIHLFVDGNDWYVTGYIDDDAYYWKNGEFTPVKMQHPVGLSWVEADDIYVIDGDVYVAGPGGTSDDWIEFYLVQWKNGEIITDGAITDTLPGGGNDYYNHARVRGLHVQ